VTGPPPGSRVRRALAELQVTRSARLGPVVFHGRSMEPFLRDGDALVVAPAPWAELRPGDVVTYRLDDRYPTCRVFRRQGPALALRADNWPFAAFRIWEPDLLGRVVERRRGDAVLRAGDVRWRLAAARAVARWRAGAALARARRGLAPLGRVRRRWAAWRQGYRELPAGVEVAVAALGDLRCGTHPRRPGPADAGRVRLVDGALFARLVDDLPAGPALHVTGSAEPLLHPELAALLRRARARAPRRGLSLATTGSPWPAGMEDALVEAAVDEVRVRLDRPEAGVDPELREALAALARRRRHREETRPRVTAECEMAAADLDAGLPALVALAWELGVQEVRLRPRPDGGTAAGAPGASPRDEAAAGGRLRDAIKRADSRGIRLGLAGGPGRSCLAGAVPHVQVDGRVGACDDPSGVAGFRAAWEAPAYRARRARAARGVAPGAAGGAPAAPDDLAARLRPFLEPG
jgi:hypothetical protein